MKTKHKTIIMDSVDNFVPVKDLSYNQAVTELDEILRTMQSDDCDIDRLTAYTRRASELLTECRRRLTATDEELKSILSELEK